MKCRPHVWNYQEWLPIIRGSEPEKHDSIRCMNCGRVLFIKDMYPNQMFSIAHSIASRVYGGDEYSEVHESAWQFFHKDVLGLER